MCEVWLGCPTCVFAYFLQSMHLRKYAYLRVEPLAGGARVGPVDVLAQELGLCTRGARRNCDSWHPCALRPHLTWSLVTGKVKRPAG
jgi:hypothetical protein